ncbi:MAG: outer membrane protein transport protein [candidate division Zixibacteria bacterium]|nr:outer membrane protein transport protein [candidate division Zixibacteria bacterium]
MRIVKFSISLLTIFALISPTLSAGGYEITSVGTRARAMGGAFRAIADDWTAAYYNPAGYAFVNDNQLGASLSMLHPRHEIIPDYRWGGVYETGIFNDRTNYNDHEILSSPSAGFIARLPIWGETVFGLSAYQPFDYNVSWTLYDLPSAYNADLGLPSDQYRTDLDVAAFQLTVSREFMEDKLSVGLGLEILRGDLIFNNLLLHDNPMADPFDDRPFDKIPHWSNNDGRGWGLGFRTGFLLKANDKLNFAATAHIPADITIKGEANQIFYMPKLPFTPFPEGSVGYLFTAGEKVEYKADFETKLALPASFGFGLAYTFSEKLVVALDAEYTLWSSFENLEFKYSNDKGLTGSADTSLFSRTFFIRDMTVLTDWKDAGKVMLGASYRYNDYLTLMAGSSIDQSPIQDDGLFTPHFVDTGDKYSINGGFTLHINQWDLGFVQTYIHAPDLTIESLTDVNNDGLVDNFPGDYKADTFETLLSFNYRF